MSRCFPALSTAALLVAAACSTPGSGDAAIDSMPDSMPAAEAGPGLHAILSLDSTTVGPGDTIRFAMRVVNGTADTAVLEFTSTQRVDLWITRPDGESVYTWSMDKLFGQMLGQDSVAPGDTLEFRETAPAPAQAGEYRLRGAVTASNHDLADTATVTVSP
jgi:hypothetical protein